MLNLVMYILFLTVLYACKLMTDNYKCRDFPFPLKDNLKIYIFNVVNYHNSIFPKYIWAYCLHIIGF